MISSTLSAALRRSSSKFNPQTRALAALFSTSAGPEATLGGASNDGRPLGRDLGTVQKTLAGILAVAGSGLGVWLLADNSESECQALALADSDVGDLRQKKRKPRFFLNDSYRRRVFFKYEKRLRLRSPPEKIFEYFASYRTPKGEEFMSPADLMRAVVPVFPSSESDIVREGHLRGEPDPGKLDCAPSTFFMLFDTNNDGLISFPEYIFFVTLLSIPEASLDVAFKMFDLDCSGHIDKEEFKKVMALMRSHNRQGAYHKDGLRIGMKVSHSVEDGGLLEYFFGKDGTGYLQHDTFVQFLRDLHDEIIRLEFAHYDFKSSGTISAKDFALSMAASADMNHINKLLDRADEIDSNSYLSNIRITFEEFKSFADLRKRLQPLALAIFSYGKVNGMLTKEDFVRATSHICGVPVTKNMVDIIFHVFDANRDGSLSFDEFLTALQRRETDICRPTTTGLLKLLPCWSRCSNQYTFPEINT